MARYASYIRASTDTQETAHQRDAIDSWLDERDIDPDDVDRYADLSSSAESVVRVAFSNFWS